MKHWMMALALCLFSPTAAEEFEAPEAPETTNAELGDQLPDADELSEDFVKEEVEFPEAPDTSNWEPTPVPLPQAVDEGDSRAVRRFVKKQLKLAETAAEKKRWLTVSEKVALLEELASDQERIEKRLRELQDQLTAMAALQVQRGNHRAEEKDWSGAVAAWKKALELRPGYKPAKAALKRSRSAIRDRAERLYRRGIDRYVKDDIQAAIDAWEKALLLSPGHAKVIKALRRAKEKKTALEK